MTRDIHGIHHTGIPTRDIDGSDRTYASLGFTLSPCSRHLLSARPGRARVLGCTVESPVVVPETTAARLGIVRASHAGDVLHGERAPAPSCRAAMTVLVDDVGHAGECVGGGGTATRSIGGGFFVSARQAYGAGLFLSRG